MSRDSKDLIYGERTLVFCCSVDRTTWVDSGAGLRAKSLAGAAAPIMSPDALRVNT
jgi:hypothetical protein